MKCIIIEDQPPAQRILKKYIADMEELILIATFSDGIKGLKFLDENEVDLIFLDIHLPKISGIDFLKTLKNPPPVILTTAFPDFALESYDLGVVDYLLKPFSFARFVKAVSKVSSIHTQPVQITTKNYHVYIKSGYEYFKVTIDEILYIKSDNDYTEIVLTDKKHLSNESLKYWLDYFGEDIMMRVHKSFIVNKAKINKISNTAITIESKIEIPIGRVYKDSVANLIDKLNS